MIPQSTTDAPPFAGSHPHGLRWVFVVLMTLVWVLAAHGDADAQRRRRRGRSKPAKKPAPSKADAPRTGPADPEQSDIADPGDAPSRPSPKANAKVRKGKKTQVFDFTGLNLSGSERKPQLLYFLDRAQEELKRASLKRRSFVPEMVRSLDEESL